MRSTFRFVLPFGLIALWAVATLIWVRSYWRVDKLWVQVLPKVAVEARLTPGQVTVGTTSSTVRLPIGDSHWFSWPVDTYFAEFIPPPSNALFCEFQIYNGTVTIPLWCLVLVSALPSFALVLSPLAHATLTIWFKRATAHRSAIAAAIPTSSLLGPSGPLVVVGPAAPEAQSAPIMQVVS